MTSNANHARNALRVLRSRIDAHFDTAAANCGDLIQCAPGCDACCHARFSVFAIEAERIAHALDRMEGEDPELRARVRVAADDPQHQDRCPMLIDGHCTIYAERPVICRSHGLAMAEIDEDDAMTVSSCSLNFRGGNPPTAGILMLRAVNEPLAAMASLWNTHSDESDRVELSALARTAASAKSD